MKITGIEDLQKTIKALEDSHKTIKSYDGTIIDLNKEKFLTQSFLHQGTKDITEADSAKFEAKNKKLFDAIVEINNRFSEAFKKLADARTTKSN